MKGISEYHKYGEGNRYVYIIGGEEFVSSFPLSFPDTVFISIKVDEGWFNVILNLDLEQTYELDTSLYLISLDGSRDSYTVPYEFNGLTVDIYNEKIEQIILDTL